METGAQRLPEMLPPHFVGPLPVLKVLFGSKRVWSVFLDILLVHLVHHETRCAPVPLTCVGAAGCANHEQQHPAAPSLVLHTCLSPQT